MRGEDPNRIERAIPEIFGKKMWKLQAKLLNIEFFLSEVMGILVVLKVTVKKESPF